METQPRPIARQTMVIGHKPIIVILSQLAHPVVELEGGAVNEYLAKSIVMYAHSHQLSTNWRMVAEVKSDDGIYTQIWLPAELTGDAAT